MSAANRNPVPVLVLLAFLVSGEPAEGQTPGYSVASDQLVELDLETGDFSVVAAVGTFGVGGLTMAADGSLYSVSYSNDDLWRIDPATGSSTRIGSLGVDVDVDTGLAFDACGALRMVTNGRLYDVDPGAGDATLVRDFGQEILALTATGDELLALVAVGAASRLATIDPGSGASSLFGDPVFLPTFQEGLDFDRQGRLWGVYWMDGPIPGPSVSSIVRYDPATGQVLRTRPLPIAQVEPVIGGNLAISPPRGFCAGALPIPTSSGISLLALAALLGTAALLRMWRRERRNAGGRAPRRDAVRAAWAGKGVTCRRS